MRKSSSAIKNENIYLISVLYMYTYICIFHFAEVFITFFRFVLLFIYLKGWKNQNEERVILKWHAHSYDKCNSRDTANFNLFRELRRHHIQRFNYCKRKLARISRKTYNQIYSLESSLLSLFCMGVAYCSVKVDISNKDNITNNYTRLYIDTGSPDLSIVL